MSQRNQTEQRNNTYMLQCIKEVRKGDSIIIGESRENGILHYRGQGWKINSFFSRSELDISIDRLCSYEKARETV